MLYQKNLATLLTEREVQLVKKIVKSDRAFTFVAREA
jgi:hypothetical protein